MKEKSKKKKRKPGREKALHHIQELLEYNADFQKRLKQIQDFADTPLVSNDAAFHEEIRNQTIKLAIDFKLDFTSWDPITELVYTKEFTPALHDIDLCKVNYDGEVLDENIEEWMQEDDIERALRYSHYPVSISISGKAGVEDVRKFVRDNWLQIREVLDKYEKQMIVKKRPQKERDEYIWKNQNKFPSRLVLTKEVRKKFNLSLDFTEFNANKIIERMNKRYAKPPDN